MLQCIQLNVILVKTAVLFLPDFLLNAYFNLHKYIALCIWLSIYLTVYFHFILTLSFIFFPLHSLRNTSLCSVSLSVSIPYLSCFDTQFPSVTFIVSLPCVCINLHQLLLLFLLFLFFYSFNRSRASTIVSLSVSFPMSFFLSFCICLKFSFPFYLYKQFHSLFFNCFVFFSVFHLPHSLSISTFIIQTLPLSF